MSRSIRWIAVLLLIAQARVADAQNNPLARIATFKRIAVDPDNSYPISESHGPWMILAASFAGEGAEEDARQLVQELRRRFKWNAVTCKQHYDYTQPVRGKGINEFGDPKMMRYRQNGAFDEIAVLIGDFASVDAPELQATLDAVKYCRPECLQLDSKTADTSLRFAGLRAWHKKINGNEEKRRKGPLGQAFVTRNPLLPQEYFTPVGIDPLVERINSGVEHSLLGCPGNYSVRVATFRGNVIIDPKEVARVESTGQMQSQLMQAAERAHQLTGMLRKRGVEAYEFHDRHESIVTVGSFVSVGEPRADGRTEIDARVLKVMNNYGARQQPLPGGGQSGLQPRSLGGIPFDVQPIPVAVPKKSVARAYTRQPTVR